MSLTLNSAALKARNPQKAKLIALLVGIAEYNHSSLVSLPGCLNDLAEVKGYLSAYCKNNGYADGNPPKELCQEQATRENIIAGFSIFDQAKNGDICLFYFTGHGTQIKAPNEFGQASPYNQALVCYKDPDSDDVPLVIDKELSYLIAQATKGKDLHFLVITDCCHSGSNTKSSKYLIKSAPPVFPFVPVDKYYGYDDYSKAKKTHKKHLIVPRGSHIKLASALDSQEAKQQKPSDNNFPKSLFTQALFQILRNSGGKISYENLICKVRSTIRNSTRNQTPVMQLIGLDSSIAKSYFLNYSQDAKPPQVIFRKSTSLERISDIWIMEAGHIHGVGITDKLRVGKHLLPLIKIYDTFSWVDLDIVDNHVFKEDQSYLGQLIPEYDRPLFIGFAPDGNVKAIEMLKFVLLEQESRRIKIVEEGESPHLIVQTSDQSYGLTHPDDGNLLFKRPKWSTTSEIRVAARIFFIQLQKVADFFHLKNIENSNPSLEENCIDIQIEHSHEPYRYMEVGNHNQRIIKNEGEKNQTFSTFELDKNLCFPWSRENDFRYFYDIEFKKGKGPWFPPAFKLQLTNNSDKPLWVSAMYCGGWYRERDFYNINYIEGQSDTDFYPYESTLFGITDQFLRPTKILPGEKVLMEDEYDLPGSDTHFGTNLIELNILDDYFDNGLNELKDFIKILVSENQFDTRIFNQVGVEINSEFKPSIQSSKHSPKRKRKPEKWRTYNIDINIIRPRKLGMLERHLKDNELSLGPLTIYSHQFFQALVITSTMSEIIRTTRIQSDGEWEEMSRPDIIFWENFSRFEIIYLTQGLGEVEGCSVIEFFLTNGKGEVSEEQPLKLELKKSFGRGWSLKPMGYNSQTRSWTFLKFKKKGEQFFLSEFPPQSPSLIPGLPHSVKFFFVATRPSKTKKSSKK